METPARENDEWMMVSPGRRQCGVPTTYEEARRRRFNRLLGEQREARESVARKIWLVTPKLVDKVGEAGGAEFIYGENAAEFAYSLSVAPRKNISQVVNDGTCAGKKPIRFACWRFGRSEIRNRQLYLGAQHR